MGPTYRHNMVTNESLWVQICSSITRKSKFIVGALILFLASSAFILNSDWRITGPGLRVPPGLHNRPAPVPTKNPLPSPKPETGPPAQENTGDDEPRPQSAVLSPDAEGVLLSAGMPSFTSPSGRYSLVLQDDGDLVLSLTDKDGSPHPVWWTGTGDGHMGGRMLVLEKQKDRFRIVVNAILNNAWTTVWHSDLVPGCKVKEGEVLGRDNQLQSTGLLEMVPGQLELSDQGRLSIAGLCDLYVSPREREKERSLAVIVAGLYRTNHESCKTHMDKLIAKHPSFTRIDVFAYVLYEPADMDIHHRSEESIKAELQKCYGSHLKSVDVQPLALKEEDYPGGSKAMAATSCGEKLRRLNNQLKAVALAAERWWAWTIANGYIHDTVLRIRPETLLKVVPEFKSLDALGQNTLVLPHPHREKYIYCARMRGPVGVGPTDQIAYGSATAMSHWLWMYDRFHQMMDLAGSPTGPAQRNFSGCEVMPQSPLASDCQKPVPCSIECMVAWYLDARDVNFHVEWGWEHNLLKWRDLYSIGGADAERIADHDVNEDEDDGMFWP